MPPIKNTSESVKKTILNFTKWFSENRLLNSLIVASGIFSIYLIFNSFLTGKYQLFILSAVFSLTFIIGIFITEKSFNISKSIKILIFTILLEVSISLFSGVFPIYSGYLYALIAIEVAFIIATSLERNVFSDWLIYIGLLGAIGSIHLSVLAPIDQIVVSVFLQTCIFLIASIFLLVLLFLFISKRIAATLRVKLTIAALLLTIIPLVVLSIINNRFLRNSIENQAEETLRVAANQTASVVDDFFYSNAQSIEEESSLSTITDYLNVEINQRSGSNEETAALLTLTSLQAKQKLYSPSYAILNINGYNQLDTFSENIGITEVNADYFRTARLTGSQNISSILFDSKSREAYFNFITPIFDINKQILGYLRVRYDARILQSLLESEINLAGERSYPILIDENGLRIADTLTPGNLYHTVSKWSDTEYNDLRSSQRIPIYLNQDSLAISQNDFITAISNNASSDYFTTSTEVEGVVIQQSGVVASLQYQPWKVIYVQEVTSIINALNEQNKLSIVIATIVAGIIGLIVTVLSNLFTQPIFQLTETAEKISAGDLSLQAKVVSNDEIGILGKSFNTMTTQLKEFINTLELRVRERTDELARRNETLQFKTRQLQTVSDLAHRIVSTRDIESLLQTVTTLISSRFGYYHVGVFLNDENNEYAVLRAANSEGGKKMLERQHKLLIGQVGIVGYSAGTGEARVATDVGQDAVFFNNPDLPETKSEMAIPLKVEERIIGVLDVQSIISNAFSQDDIDLFSTLSDQIAVAINNDQLYSETAKALEESEKTHRQYLQQEWSRQSSEISTKSYKFTEKGLVPLVDDLPEVQMVLDSSRPILRTQKKSGKSDRSSSVLAVPILLRGETIGVIHLQVNEKTDFEWSQNELLTVQSVAEQVALTLENARLFEQTMRRADRERKVLEITSKIRSTNDPQQMLQIALEELKRNLSASKAQIVLSVLEKDYQTGGTTQSLKSKKNDTSTLELNR